MSTTGEKLYKHAKQDLGLKETPGKGSTLRIRQAIKRAAGWLDGDDSVTAWCGCIRGLWGLETGTGVPKEHYRAKSWLEWGRPVNLEDAVPGDTVVLKRPGGYHVGLFDRLDAQAGKVWLLGGNQGNAVNVSPFSIHDVVGVRWLS
jgi:uncharacterized protein (TIGR02594 family)